MRSLPALVVLAPTLLCCAPSETERGADSRAVGAKSFRVGIADDDTDRPLGGGEEYDDWIEESQADWVVNTGQDLEYALEQAHIGAGGIIYVPDSAVIDLTGFATMYVYDGVTLASGRGNNGSIGGLIFKDDNGPNAMMVVLGSNVRITGLRMRGPDTGGEPPGTCDPNDKSAIWVFGAPNTDPPRVLTDVLVDNNEVWGWPYAAVWTDNNDGGEVTVSHNHIHHNRRSHPHDSPNCPAYGLGYGVVANVGFTVVQSNVFDHNRHDVASHGLSHSSYEAKFNLSLTGMYQPNTEDEAWTESSYDVHGGADRNANIPGDEGPPSNVAGEWIEIHSNTVLQVNSQAVLLRGVPNQAANIHDNEFRCVPPPPPLVDLSCVGQINATGNFNVFNNAFGATRHGAWYVALSGWWPHINRQGPGGFWGLRRLETTSPFGLSWDDVALRDFNGDGRADALRTRYDVLEFQYKWELSSAATADFGPWNGSGLGMSDLGFADFDGNGTTDVFASWGGNWWVSDNGSGVWHWLAGSTYPVSDLGFADFNGNGKADVFHATGTNWWVSWDGVTNFDKTALLASTYTLKDVRFGNFVGNDHFADVFIANGTEWMVSAGGTANWQHMTWSQKTVDQLRLGDFDGDGSTDVFTVEDDGSWNIWFSRGTDGEWVQFNKSDYALSDLRFADVNGDGKTDVLVAWELP